MDRLMQEAPKSLRGRMYRRDNSRPKENKLLVLKTGIAGVKFHIENEEENTALNEITPGTELKLFREPDNEYDEWAVAVYLTDDDKIGYISRFKNETIARLMDAGKKFIAVVDEQTERENTDEEPAERRRSKRAPTENYALPFSVYMIETL